jgi:hypothetical protein
MASQSNGKSSDRGDTLDLVKQAAVQLATLTGHRPEKVLGIERQDDSLRISFELVEFERIPHSTDLLGCYVVEVDKDGDLVGYERSRRYQRGQADGGDG